MTTQSHLTHPGPLRNYDPGVTLGEIARQKLASGLHAYRSGGLANLFSEGARRVSKGPADIPSVIQQAPGHPKRPLDLMAHPDDILGVDWKHLQTRSVKTKAKTEKLHVAWVMSPPGPSSGGHQNLFRFIAFLEAAGHRCTVHIYSTNDPRTVSEVEMVLQKSYASTVAAIRRFDGDFRGADAVFATGWETAYPVARHLSNERALYFVQDFEPFFYSTGSATALAENTYRMGFFGVTAGEWLAEKLSREYGMETRSFSFAADKDFYTTVTPSISEKGVFFYARPVTGRRAFELGILALEELHRRSPSTPIHLAGWDVSDLMIPFPHTDHGALNLEDLPGIYNLCDAALVLSLTNLSLLPMELMSCGVVPVMNSGPNTEMVCRNPNAIFSDLEPNALADALLLALESNTSGSDRETIRESVDSRGWSSSGDEFVRAVQDHCYGETNS